MSHKNIPVIIGVGQTVDHWDGKDAALAPSYVSLGVEAGKAAFSDTGSHNVKALIDTIVCVRTMQDSVARNEHPFGRCENLPGTLAAKLGLNSPHAIYSQVGGQTPQELLNEMALKISEGDSEAVLLIGSEAIRAMKLAQRGGHQLDWSETVESDFENRGLGANFTNAYEFFNGFGPPMHAYGVFENATRHLSGQSKAEQLREFGELFAPFSEVAANNPYSQYGTPRSIDFLETEAGDNYRISDTYLKWHIAQDSVNQAAAVILTSEAKADELGIAKDKRVYLHGAAKVADHMGVQRMQYTHSDAMEFATLGAMDAAGKDLKDLKHFDLYSCFPCAVSYACKAMKLDWHDWYAKGRQLTQTGGLPYFGGAGNNYSMHGICSMVDTLRANAGDYGLVLANGGYLSKEAVGIYSTEKPERFSSDNIAKAQAKMDALKAPAIAQKAESGKVQTFGVKYARGNAFEAYVIADTTQGERFVAKAANEETIAEMKDSDVIGRSVKVISCKFDERFKCELNEFIFDNAS